MPSFDVLWRNACAEEADPKGAAARLMAAIGDLLNVTQLEYEKLDVGAVFLMDLGTLGFRGMDFNVVMISHPPGGVEEERRQADQLLEYRNVVKSDGLCFHILLGDNPSTASSETLSDNIVQVSRPDLQRLFTSNVPASVWLGIIRRQVPLRGLCPYNTTRVARGAMFHGRRDELGQLTQDLQTDFVISGARRIGKTSLLTRAHDVLRVRPEYRGRVHFFNCLPWGTVQDCFHRLTHELDPKEELRIAYGPRGVSHQYAPRNISYLLESRSRRGSRPLVLFFDELDRVVETDARNGWPFFQILAEAAYRQWIRVVFAGYRSMALLFTRVSDSPFYGRLKGLELRPLSHHECHDLVAKPLQRMEIALRDSETVQERIWQTTLGYPFFVQFYGEELFEAGSKRPEQEVGLEDVDTVEQGSDLNEFLVRHFLENTIYQGRPVAAERLCTLLLAHSTDGQRWTEADFLRGLVVARRPAGLDEVHDALCNLRSANVLLYQNGRYGFALPLLKDVLKRAYSDLEAVLQST